MTLIKSVRGVPEGQFWSPSCPVCGAPEGPEGFQYICRSVEADSTDKNRWAEVFQYECENCGVVVPLYCWPEFRVPVLIKRSELDAIKAKHNGPVLYVFDGGRILTTAGLPSGEDKYVDVGGSTIECVQIMEDR
jgi:hypothetical protein